MYNHEQHKDQYGKLGDFALKYCQEAMKNTGMHEVLLGSDETEERTNIFMTDHFLKPN